MGRRLEDFQADQGQDPATPDALEGVLTPEPRPTSTPPGSTFHEPPAAGQAAYTVGGLYSRFKSVLFGERAARWTSRIVLIVLWQLAGLLTERFPTPLGTVQFLVDELQRPFVRTEAWSLTNNELIGNLSVSLARTALGMVWVAIIGIPLGYIMGKWWRAQALFTDLVMVGIALPAYIWALLAIMWFGFGFQAPLFTIVVSATPALIVHVMQGTLSIPTELKDMSGAYGVRTLSRVRHLILPAMAGAVIAGFRLAILAGWGVTMLVEWFGQNEGVGQRARLWYDSAVFTGLLGWGLVIIVVVITFDRGIIERIDKSVHKWRAAHTGFGKLKAQRTET